MADTDVFVDVDEIERELGSWGKHQILQFIYILVSYLPVAFPVFIILFIGFTPNYQCHVLTKPLQEYGIEENLTDYVVEYGQCELTIRSNVTNSSWTPLTTPCLQGFSYDVPREKSFVSEWDLVCNRQGLGELTQTLIMLGQAIGATIFTTLSDRFGRKTVFIITFIGLTAFIAGTSFVPSYLVFNIMRISTGFIQQGLGLSLYALAIEMFPLESRGTIAAIAGLYWAVAVVFFAGFAFILKFLSWRMFQLASAAMSFHCIISYWLSDESLRWLVANNKKDEARKLVKRIARHNNINPHRALCMLEGNKELTNMAPDTSKKGQKKTETSISPKLIGNEQDLEVEKYTLLDIFKYKLLFRNSLITWYIWFINSLTYYGLYLTSVTLSTDRYLNFLINGMLEVPAGCVVWLTINRLGRKKTSIIFHTMAGLSLILSVVLKLPEDEAGIANTASIVFNFLGKFAITASWTTMFLFTPEIYPTNLRNAGIGAASAAARIGGMLAPYTDILARQAFWGPGVIFGVGSLLVNVGIVMLPETNGRELPQTMEELLSWYRGDMKLKMIKNETEDTEAVIKENGASSTM